MTTRTDHEHAAYQLGVQAAITAASWVLCGQATDVLLTTLKMLEDGDPRVDERLPISPNLSGDGRTA